MARHTGDPVVSFVPAGDHVHPRSDIDLARSIARAKESGRDVPAEGEFLEERALRAAIAPVISEGKGYTGFPVPNFIPFCDKSLTEEGRPRRRPGKI